MMWKWVAGVVSLWLMITLGIVAVSGGDLSEASSWGSTFGVANSLFSALAFVVVLLTLRSQEAQLAKQDVEIRKQNRILWRQQFETTLFNLAREFNEQVEILERNETYEGAGAYFLGKRKRILEELDRRFDEYGEDAEIDSIYTDCFLNAEDLLGPWFRRFTNIMIHIDLADLTDKEKKMYAHFASAGLSASQRILVYFDGISRFGRPVLKPLIEKFGLLNHIDDQEFQVSIGRFKPPYSDNAFRDWHAEMLNA